MKTLLVRAKTYDNGNTGHVPFKNMLFIFLEEVINCFNGC